MLFNILLFTISILTEATNVTPADDGTLPYKFPPYVQEIRYFDFFRLLFIGAIITAIGFGCLIPKKNYFKIQSIVLVTFGTILFAVHLFVMIPKMPLKLVEKIYIKYIFGILIGGISGFLCYTGIYENIIFAIPAGYITSYYFVVVVAKVLSITEHKYLGFITLGISIAGFIVLGIVRKEFSLKVSRGIINGFILLFGFDTCVVVLKIFDYLHESNYSLTNILRWLYVAFWTLLEATTIMYQFDKVMVESYLGLELGDEAENGIVSKKPTEDKV